MDDASASTGRALVGDFSSASACSGSEASRYLKTEGSVEIASSDPARADVVDKLDSDIASTTSGSASGDWCISSAACSECETLSPKKEDSSESLPTDTSGSDKGARSLPRLLLGRDAEVGGEVWATPEPT